MLNRDDAVRGASSAAHGDTKYKYFILGMRQRERKRHGELSQLSEQQYKRTKSLQTSARIDCYRSSGSDCKRKTCQV